ncbi:MAG: hypothetical protein KGJ49_08215 [Alphaproteobacteria bacterium]|nr:hypothetical protein [Alphaproteobacteria bacterium]
MQTIRLIAGAPDEPDTGDWDAICATPGPQQVIAAAYRAFTGEPLPGKTSVSPEEDDVHRVHTIWLGTPQRGVKVTEIESVESSAFPMTCIWESHGWPGIGLVWQYKLEKAGQLGYSAFRHVNLEASCQAEHDVLKFAEVYEQVIGRKPAFEQVG